MTLDELAPGRSWPGGVEVEIGCGNGHFLAEYAAHRPDTLLVGLELKAKRCRKAREKADKRGLANVEILQRGAEGFVAELAPRSVSAFHIYFPDPWPKSRHRKRRFFAMDNLRCLHDALAPGGRVWFATDFFDYYVQAKVLLLAHGGFRLAEDPAPQEAFRSVYARKFATTPIHLLCAVRGSAEEAGGDQQHEEQVGRDGGPDEGR